MTATVTAAAIPSATNTASVATSNQFDPVSGNNTASATVTPQRADLLVIKTLDNATPPQLGTVTYTISVKDLGPDAATGVVHRRCRTSS